VAHAQDVADAEIARPTRQPEVEGTEAFIGGRRQRISRYRHVVAAIDSDRDHLLGAVGSRDRELLDLATGSTKVLHRTVGDALAPCAFSIDAQAAKGGAYCNARPRHECVSDAIGVSAGQRAGGGDVTRADFSILDDSTDCDAANYRSIVGAGDSDSSGLGNSAAEAINHVVGGDDRADNTCSKALEGIIGWINGQRATDQAHACRQISTVVASSHATQRVGHGGDT
jgi:hypothetical protein